MSRTTLKKQASKGVRLGWTPLKDVQPANVVLTSVKGVKVTPAGTHKRASKSPNRNYLIP